MKARWNLSVVCSRGILPVLMMATFLAGCQTAPYGAAGGSIAPQERIALQEGGEQKGTFETRDLSVDYRFSRGGDNLNVAGTVRYADYLKYNFGQVRYFNLAVSFVDSQGKVIGSKGLTSLAGENIYIHDRLPFQAALKLPPGTASIAFTYRGEAHSADSDGSSPTYFWHYPAR